jgi:hypothetical protein
MFQFEAVNAGPGLIIGYDSGMREILDRACSFLEISQTCLGHARERYKPGDVP